MDKFDYSVSSSYQSVLNGTPTLDGLPKELFTYILKFLEGSEKFALACVNKKFRRTKELRHFTFFDFYVPGALKGSLEYVKWIRSLKYPLQYQDCMIPAARGDIKMLMWLRENKCHFNSWAVTSAADTGQLATIKWLRKTGCNWNENACLAAAASGHLKTLQWLRKNGCPWDREICLYAADTTLIGNWIRKNG